MGRERIRSVILLSLLLSTLPLAMLISDFREKDLWSSSIGGEILVYGSVIPSSSSLPRVKLLIRDLYTEAEMLVS